MRSGKAAYVTYFFTRCKYLRSNGGKHRSSGARVVVGCAGIAIFMLCYTGLAVSLFPYIIPPDITIWQAAAAPKSQLFMLYGAVPLLPIICLGGSEAGSVRLPSTTSTPRFVMPLWSVIYRTSSKVFVNRKLNAEIEATMMKMITETAEARRNNAAAGATRHEPTKSD